MVFSQDFICSSIIWIINIIFLLSLFPQIFLNYKLKTAKGLSDLFILGSLIGQASYVGYAFYANLPLVYKVMNIFYCGSLLILIVQRLYYAKYKTRFILFGLYFSNILLLSLLFFYAFNGNNNMGNFLGWLPICTGFFKKVPQIAKIHFQKTIKGFSFGFIILNIVGYLTEMFAAIFLRLPLQIIANDLKNIFLFSVFLGQFFLYRKINLD